MVTVNGRMVAVTGDNTTAKNSVQGTVDVALCGYGSQIPRISGIATYGQLTDIAIATDANGHFTFEVFGNDKIVPPGTYYTITFRNANGDVAQVNAYTFADGSTYDLSVTAPYDPNIPPPPLPVPIGNELQVIPYSAVPTFDGSQSTAWSITLSGDVTNVALQGMHPGNLYTFIIKQDATGGHRFTWPSVQLFNPTAIDKRPNATTIQTFVADEATPSNLYPIGPGTVYA